MIPLASNVPMRETVRYVKTVRTNYHTHRDRIFGPSAYHICSNVPVRPGITLKLNFLIIIIIICLSWS